MSPNPAVSVLLPFRDEQAVLNRALASLKRQTFESFEVLCLDDGSEDNSPDIVLKRAEMDYRFRYVRLPRCGIVPALNEGILRSSAPLIARMDADDVSHPRRLESQLRFLDVHLEIGVVGSLIRGFPLRRLGGGWAKYIDWLNGLVDREAIEREIFVESPLAHPSVVMRRDAVESAGGYSDVEGPEDYDLWLRCFLAGIGIAKVPEVLYYWCDRPERLSRTDDRYRTIRFWDTKARYLAEYLSKKKDLAGRPLYIWGHRLAGRLVKPLQKVGLHPIGFLNINTRRQGSTRRGLPIFPPEIIESTPGAFVISAVSNIGARDDIRKLCAGMGLSEGRDFIMAG